MQVAEIPGNEALRLAALHVIDESRQWFKARVGNGAPPRQSQEISVDQLAR